MGRATSSASFLSTSQTMCRRLLGSVSLDHAIICRRSWLPVGPVEKDSSDYYSVDVFTQPGSGAADQSQPGLRPLYPWIAVGLVAMPKSSGSCQIRDLSDCSKIP